MQPDPLAWSPILLRLAAALVAGLILGFDRTTRGRPAGVRTTMMVSTTAAAAMLLAERLASPGSGFQNAGAHFDPVRVVQGILTGMGFIGAGTIIRRDNAVVGVTTAATLWFATVVGLCFGAAQWRLGGAALVAGLAILWPLYFFEEQVPRECAASLGVTLPLDAPADLPARLHEPGFSFSSWSIVASRAAAERTFTCRVVWKGAAKDSSVPAFVARLADDPGVLRVSWEPVLS
jgi:putative Mg2+ transporter-C (MgtC) family protein